ncbi:Hypothetical predicted protein, partial [Olea europaea subsp. europaea]
VVRDLGFMIPDLLNIIVPLLEVYKHTSGKHATRPLLAQSSRHLLDSGTRDVYGDYNVIIKISVMLLVTTIVL